MFVCVCGHNSLSLALTFLQKLPVLYSWIYGNHARAHVDTRNIYRKYLLYYTLAAQWMMPHWTQEINNNNKKARRNHHHNPQQFSHLFIVWNVRVFVWLGFCTSRFNVWCEITKYVFGRTSGQERKRERERWGRGSDILSAKISDFSGLPFMELRFCTTIGTMLRAFDIPMDNYKNVFFVASIFICAFLFGAHGFLIFKWTKNLNCVFVRE